ncbi:Fe-Mn family superoxide dismutase [Paenibacillus methanolicus]|uniref:superoxide dismutase n=1 Tax=Paenibacillus methanolicus TaxID=582686 RepID=A0A5S5BUA4_9BACL|nr:Fe-Mn family superoxide dismutase [Paenibacillus methanolicus]TYP70607.1 Fe-Mn family superoxide dismutase [Paenibacillus methanolicus]
MLFVYGPYMPLRLLEEIRFWKTQEEEHTVVIREIAPNLEPPYVALLQAWEPVFARTAQMADKLLAALVPQSAHLPPVCREQVDALLRVSAEQSKRFIEQLHRMIKESAAIASSPVAVTVVHHIIRESDYFLCVLATLVSPRPDGTGAETANEAHDTRMQPDSRPPIPASSAESAAAAEREASSARASGASPSAASKEDDNAGQLRAPAAPVPIGEHKLPPLPYAYDALEPHIDAATMRIHHDKHHQSYVDGLNKAEKELRQARQTGDFALVKHWERELAFNGAGHYLHTLFWPTMSPKGGGQPAGELAAQITRDFGSFDAFKNQFSQAAEKVEGGGWAILVWSPRSRRLEILTAEKHQNLSQWDVVPVLPLDVWEHAYYLKHQNKRGDYIKSWWNVVNWPYANDRFKKASKLIWDPY